MTRILIVDDEPALTRLLEQYLVRLGYAVEACGSAAQALELFDRAPREYALVLTDLHLPGMSGQELITQLLRANPAIRIMVCSGYPFDLEVVAAEFRSQVSVLQKPFLPKMLAEEVRRMVGSGRACETGLRP